MKIILPKSSIATDPQYGPLFFLAGPVLGGGDWQTQCCFAIRERLMNFYAALPCNYDVHSPLSPYIDKNDAGNIPYQLNWERQYLQQASREGCVIFWLAEESRTHPRIKGTYARDTRGELGEWRAHLMHDRSLRVVIGGEEGFDGLDVIKRNFNIALDYEFPFYTTLEETVQAAIAKTKTI